MCKRSKLAASTKTSRNTDRRRYPVHKEGHAVYAFIGKPEIAEVKGFGLWSPQDPGKIQRVQILGRKGGARSCGFRTMLRCASKPR